jgi:DNA-binding PadR family transcriptional regulator
MYNCGNGGWRGNRRGGAFGDRIEAFAREIGEQMGEQFAEAFGTGGPRSSGGPGGAGRGGPRRGGPGGFRTRGRVFNGDELRLVLLKLVEDAPRHGYELIKEIEQRSGGVYAPSPGMVYPTLTLLNDESLVDEVPDGARKKFAITDAGRALLKAEAETVAEALSRLDALAEMSQPADAAPVRRAMRNLHGVVHNRVRNEDVGRDVQLDIAKILDEAAQKIERL